MIINNTPFMVDMGDILSEWKAQLQVNNIPLLGAVRDTPDNIMVSCIYHKNGQERKPSAGIKKSDGTYHCFACGETHTLQEVISHSFGHTDDMLGSWGWNWLLKNFLTVSVEERKDVELDFARPNTTRGLSGGNINRYDDCSIIGNNTMDYISEEELDSYRYTHPYMYKRRLTDEVIELFDIGYDSNSRCITFPIRNIDGRTLFVARRSVDTKFFNYPAGVEKPVYGLYELDYAHKQVDHLDDSGRAVFKIFDYPSEVIICESMLDCLYFWTIGKYAVALNGLGNELQFKQLNQMPCRKFILCTDSDEAGMKARKRIRANLKNKIVTEYILPEGRKDANDCTVEELKSLQEVF